MSGSPKSSAGTKRPSSSPSSSSSSRTKLSTVRGSPISPRISTGLAKLYSRTFDCPSILTCILSHCDRLTLASAAVVNKVWREVASHHLYRHISFPSAAPLSRSRGTTSHYDPYTNTRVIDYHSHDDCQCSNRDAIPLPNAHLIRIFADGSNTMATCKCANGLPHACHLVGGISPKAGLLSAITSPISRVPCDLAWLVAENLTRVVLFLKPSPDFEYVPKEERLYRSLPPTIKELTLIFQPPNIPPAQMFGEWTRDWSADVSWSSKKLISGLADMLFANPDQRLTICDAHHLGAIWVGGIDSASADVFKMHVLREVAIRGMKEGWTPEKLRECVRNIRCIPAREFANEPGNEHWFTQEEREFIPL